MSRRKDRAPVTINDEPKPIHCSSWIAHRFTLRLGFSFSLTVIAAVCVKADTGEIMWQERVGGKHYASPTYADGKIYFLSETGESTIIKARPEFKIVARSRIDETCQASYAVPRRQLFIRNQENLYRISLNDGDK